MLVSQCSRPGLYYVGFDITSYSNTSLHHGWMQRVSDGARLLAYESTQNLVARRSSSVNCFSLFITSQRSTGPSHNVTMIVWETALWDSDFVCGANNGFVRVLS